MCGVVPGQCAPLMETGRPFQTPIVFSQLQPQSAESISSEQAGTPLPSVRRSVPSLCCAMKEGPLEHTVHRWRFTSSIPPSADKEGRMLSLPHSYCDSFKVSRRWLYDFSRNVWFCCGVHTGYRLMPMTTLIALCEIRPWNKHLILPRGRLVRNAAVSHSDLLCPRSNRGVSGQTWGQNPERSCREKVGLHFCFYFVLQTTEQQFILMTWMSNDVVWVCWSVSSFCREAIWSIRGDLHNLQYEKDNALLCLLSY